VRRSHICLAIGALLLAFCFPAKAQQPLKPSRIGILADVSSPQIDAFREGLRALGYVEGQNLTVERRYAEGKHDRFPELAAELVSLKVDVILAVGQATPYAAKSVKTIRCFRIQRRPS
jgi:putative ABC transport system substrate-binding protein